MLEVYSACVKVFGRARVQADNLQNALNEREVDIEGLAKVTDEVSAANKAKMEKKK